jgi:hypothetical protein
MNNFVKDHIFFVGIPNHFKVNDKKYVEVTNAQEQKKEWDDK